MRIRPGIVISALLGGLALGWAFEIFSPRVELGDVEARLIQFDDSPAAQRAETQRAIEPQPAPPAPAVPDTVEFDVEARAQFNDKAREFFARAPALPDDERQRQAQQIERELSLLERVGGLSAGETFLVRTGLIRETIADPAQQAAAINALQERYKNETSRRVSQASFTRDPAFDSYKIREGQIVAEVMALQAIPDGLTRDEYLRRRLQSAREQLLSN